MATLDQLRSLFPDAQSDSDVIKKAATEFGIDPMDIASELGVKISSPGMWTSVKRGVGQVESALGSTARDLGADRAGRALESYGEDVTFRNPAAVNTVGEALSSPWQTAKEAVGELVPQVGFSGATALGGRAIGGALGAPLGPAGVIAGQAIGGSAGAYLGNLAQEYGGIRAEQRESGREDKTRALATGAAAATLDTAFGAERLVNKVGNKGLNILSREAGKDLAPHVLKQTGLGIAGEAGTETVQTALERTGAFKDLASDDALNEYGMAAIKGGIGGGAIRGGMSLFAGQRQADAGSNDVSQAFTQKDATQPDITTTAFQPRDVSPDLMAGLAGRGANPLAGRSTMYGGEAPAVQQTREVITEDGEIIQVPVAQTQQAPAVAGGSTEIAQAQQQAQQQAAQQQAQAQQAQAADQAAQQFGVVNPATPAVGSAFGQKVYGPNIPAVANAIATFTAKMPPQQVQLAQAITKANADTGGQLIKFKFKFNANDVMASVDKGFQAVGKVASQFQIAHVDSVDEAAAILNDQSEQAKGDKLEQLNAIFQALTGQNTNGYEAAQLAQLAKGAKDDKLQLQNNAGLREVPVSGGATEASTGGDGGVRPTQVQPIGATSVGAGPLDIQAGQPSAGGVRSSAGDVPNVGGGQATPQVSEAPNGQETTEGGQAAVQPTGQAEAVPSVQQAGKPARAAEEVKSDEELLADQAEEITAEVMELLIPVHQRMAGGTPQERAETAQRLRDFTFGILMNGHYDTLAVMAKDFGIKLHQAKDWSAKALAFKAEPEFLQKLKAAYEAAASKRGLTIPELLTRIEAKANAAINDKMEVDKSISTSREQGGPRDSDERVLNVGFDAEGRDTGEIEANEGLAIKSRKSGESIQERFNAVETNQASMTKILKMLDEIKNAQTNTQEFSEARVAGALAKYEAALVNGTPAPQDSLFVLAYDAMQKGNEGEAAMYVEELEAIRDEKLTKAAEQAKKQTNKSADLDKPEKETKNAVQKRSTKKVPVQERTGGGEALGEGNAEESQAATEGEAEAKQEVIKTPQEQYEALAAETNLLPPYEALDARERAQIEDQAYQGELTLASLNTMFSGNAKFGKDVRANNPYTAAELTKEIEAFVRTSISSRKLTVVNSVEDLTNSADKVVQQIGAVLAVEGAYGVAVNGRAFLIANRIEKGMGRAKFMHEVGAHLGLENLLPKATYDRLVAQIKKWTNSDADIDEVTLAARAEMRVLNANTPAEDYDAELLAYFIEEAVQAGVDPTASGKENSALREWFRTLWAAFKVAVRKLGYNPESMTAQDIVDMAFGAARLEMSGTYHGTAANFRNFRNKYIGSGEGATAYGWGTYLAERYGIAKGYYEADVRRKTKQASAKPEGNLMRVDTSVADDELFNYNATVADQPQRVKDAIKSMLDPIAEEVLDRTNSDVDELTGRDLFGTGENDLGLLSRLIMDDVLVADGDTFNKAVQQGQFHKAASLLLEEAGIAGIKHLDARSRGTATSVIQFRGKSYNRDELRDAARAAYAAKDDQQTFEMGMLRSLLQNGVAHVRAMHQSKQAYYERLFYKTDKESAERFNLAFDEEKARADAKRKTKDLFETKALDWLDKHESDISMAENPRTYNRILFSDKNIFRVGTQVAADRQRMRFGKEAAQPQGVFSKAGTWLDQALTNPKEALTKLKLGFLTLDQLAELDKTANQVVRAYSDVMTAMQKTSKDMVYKASQIDQLWAKLTKKDSDNLSSVMRDATRAQFDPALGVAGKNQTEQDIMDAYRALPSSAKDVYAKVKKYYEDAFKTRLAIMEESAAKLGGKELDEIRELYSKLKGPYFPLGRTGSYYAVGMSPRVAELTAKKEDQGLSSSETTELATLRKQADQYKTSSFNTLYEAKKAAEQFKKDLGESYYNETEVNIESAMSKMPNFAKLEESITAELGGETRAEVKNMLAKLMFDSLPEHHALKNQMRREGIYGENEDMRQVFAQTSISQAHYISRLQFGGELNASMLDIGKAARRDIEMRQIQNELKLRTKLSMDNTQSALTDSMVNASYFAHLGLSPAFLLTNMTQVPMITAPWLGARHGVGATKRAMAAALVDTAKLIKSTYKDGDWRSELDWNSMFPVGSNEDRMFRDLLDRNVLDITMEHDLAAVANAQKGIFDDKISKATGGKLGGMSDVVKLVNTPVRITELANRAVTALSAYRLKMQALATAPMTDEERHKAAVDYAARAVSETQLNYSELNAPRHMRQVFGSKPLAKMIFQFRKYQQGMLYLIAKSISDALPGSKATAEDRRIARRTLAGLYMTTGLMAGTTGMPLMGTVGVAGIANLVASAFGDDDEPFDFETEYRNFLTDWLGKDMALLVAKGVPAALGADLSKRVGMGDIANPIPFVQRGQTGQSTVANVLYAAGGAPIGMVGTMYDGIVAMANGDVMKGMEKIVPVKAVKDALRTYRYTDEGMTDKRGNVILAPEKFDTWDLALRGMGFTPTKEAEYYAANAAVQAAKTAATDARTRLLREYSEAKLKGETTEDVDAKIAEFNERHPEKGVKIDFSTKLKSVQARRKMAAERTESGVRIGKYEKPFAGEARFATEE